MNKKKIFNINIYECKVIFIIVNDSKDINKYTSKFLNINDENDYAGVTININPTYYIIISKENLKDYNTILHELFHIVDEITNDRDIKDWEAKAYLQGFIGNKILKYVDNYRITK